MRYGKEFREFNIKLTNAESANLFTRNPALAEQGLRAVLDQIKEQILDYGKRCWISDSCLNTNPHRHHIDEIPELLAGNTK